MKLGPVTKLDKRKLATSKKFNNDIMPENCDVISIFSDLRANFEQSRSQIPNAWYLKEVTFYEN